MSVRPQDVPPATRTEAWGRFARKLLHPRDLFSFLRYRLREGNEYLYFDFVDFFPPLARGLAHTPAWRMDLEAPVFLAGLRRSGTTLFYRLMNAHPDLRLFNERFPGDRRNGHGFVTEANVWSVRDPAAFRKVVAGYLGPMDRLGRARWGSKLAMQIAHPDLGSPGAPAFWHLLECFPRARVLAIVRDPRDFVLSAVHRRGFDDAFWAAEYRAMVDLFVEACERRPEQVRRVRYEELVASPEDTLAACCDFVGLPYHAAMLDPRRWSGKGPREYERGAIVAGSARWQSVAEQEPERVRAIEALCFPNAERVGYRRELGD